MSKTLNTEERYIANKIKYAENRYWQEIDDLRSKSIIWPILLLVLSGLLWVINYVLSEFPIISWIYIGFKVDKLCSGLMTIILIVSIIWLSIGLPIYFCKKRTLIKKLDKEIKEIRTAPIDTMTLVLYETVLEPAQKEALHNVNRNMEALKRNNIHQSHNVSDTDISMDSDFYEEDSRNYKRKHFCFVDASGSYRYWGDDFIDTQGNWCRWGTGFYDYAGNYIRWGDTYQDSSGSYRHWGDDFIDGAGNWVKFVR